MKDKLEYLVVTTKRTNLDFVDDMNIKSPVIVTNQSDSYQIDARENKLMLTTDSTGVGVNRNIGLSLSKTEYSLLVDDDMVFYEYADKIIEEAVNKYFDADLIIFSFDYVKDNEFVRSRMKKSERIRFFNCLNYGICCTLIRNSRIKQKNITFSNLFGGGCKYSCGEDSLFFLDCIRSGLKIYSYAISIGKNEYRESTWFKGFNEKYFFDKGAWISCAFPKLKHFIKWYFAFRFRKVTKVPFLRRVSLINQGIKGYALQREYEES